MVNVRPGWSKIFVLLPKQLPKLENMGYNLPSILTLLNAVYVHVYERV